jgi:aminoglycoside phosphotransferase (APT) family kinase protein
VQELVERLVPSGRLLRSSPLAGGVDSLAERLDIEAKDGTVRSFAVRRSSSDPAAHSYVTPQRFAYEWRALNLARAAGLSAPEPVLLDADGDCLGIPAIVLEYVSGRPEFPGDDIAGWISEMADGLACIHRVTPDNFDLSALNDRGWDWIRAYRERMRGWAGEDPLALEVMAALSHHFDSLDITGPTLTHGDFWSGNTVWRDGRIVAVLDWSGAALGDPRRDISGPRVQLVMSHGLDAADEFCAAYERAAGRSPGKMLYFDLYHGLEPYLETEHWLEGAIALGEKTSPGEAHARLAKFLRRALRGSGR